MDSSEEVGFRFETAEEAETAALALQFALDNFTAKERERLGELATELICGLTEEVEMVKSSKGRYEIPSIEYFLLKGIIARSLQLTVRNHPDKAVQGRAAAILVKNPTALPEHPSGIV